MIIETQNKILGVNGSPRIKGNSDILLNHFMESVRQNNIEEKIINLRDYKYSGCIGCERCRKDKICTGLKDDFNQLYPDIISSKGLVLICPTHNYNITAWMKAFIDRLYCFYNFENPRPGKWSSNLANQNRKAVIIAICEQENEADMGYTAEAMSKPLQALGYEICDVIKVLNSFDRGKVKENQALLTQIKATADSFAKLIK
ncbi:MAG: flavodoxin family protein [Spirochaetia bacterium]|nr:flavodoxin family protein [Spirochaetia bacterium]